jgi:hypothetical protein
MTEKQKELIELEHQKKMEQIEFEHKCKMSYVESLIKLETLKHNYNKEIQRIRTAEIRKSFIRKQEYSKNYKQE